MIQCLSRLGHTKALESTPDETTPDAHRDHKSGVTLVSGHVHPFHLPVELSEPWANPNQAETASQTTNPINVTQSLLKLPAIGKILCLHAKWNSKCM
jgi:hypothetical protein